MAIEPTKKIFEILPIVKKEEVLKDNPFKKRKSTNKTIKKETTKIDIRV
ncbi:MAG: hypothetical protein N2511_01645 [Thermodesulfovibrionales bacterium]|nr:hypothetical protein [Thermodesulfovibrionales bacterium]